MTQELGKQNALPRPFYQRNSAPFDASLFINPTAEYRGAPFWAWNTRLERSQLLRQIAVLKAMGMGGFHMHPRTGLATEYLGNEFMGHVKACVEQAQADGMLAWLYDEDRWPSGFGGGLVTREERFRARHLLFTPTAYNGTPYSGGTTSHAAGFRNENGILVARYSIKLEQGRLASYRRLEDSETSTENVWFAYLESQLPTPWWNNQTYVDTLNPEAIRRFIEVTHERYASVVGAHFGTTIPAIFTDEPQFSHKDSLRFANEQRDVILPWTPDFGTSYQQAYGSNPLETLPELVWELPQSASSLARYRYHDHIAERFSSAYSDQLGAWCEQHGLMLTGHMMKEQTLASQTSALGEAMRSYRAFQLPGIDILCDNQELNTAKQAASAAHQYGRPGVISELYGVTNWDFDFRGHKAQGDWQAALGITVRVHHLAWVSMAGEAKRDYPASISYQSPWHLEYPLVENHFARLNTVLTRGKSLIRIGVIHAIESYWLAYGPLEQTNLERGDQERRFENLTHWLLFGLQDFDFIAESLFPELCHAPNSVPLMVGEAAYDVIIVPSLRTIRSSTLERLEQFGKAGGNIIFMGEVPALVDAQPSSRAVNLAANCNHVSFERGAILSALEPWRELEVRLANGSSSESLLYQIRQEETQRHVFICNTDRERALLKTRIALNGTWRVTELETMTGKIHQISAKLEAGKTVFEHDFAAHGHLLLTLEPISSTETKSQIELVSRPQMPLIEDSRLSDPVPITLSEPNVLLLDYAQYRLNNEPWQAETEILRLDTILRTRLEYPLRMEVLAQPWTQTDLLASEHTLTLRFTITTDYSVSAPLLALEDAAAVTITVNGLAVPLEIVGWWVDEAIQTIRLPQLKNGKNLLEITMPYHPQSNPEWCYLLGDFGVDLRGRHSSLTAPVRELAWGDWTRQGLPFYAGNVTYHCTLTADASPRILEVAHFKAPVLKVRLDKRDLGRIAFAPYQLELPVLKPGNHQLDITAYGNRANAFGALHNTHHGETKAYWYGPNAWRKEGLEWSDEYQLKPMGITTAPRILKESDR